MIGRQDPEFVRASKWDGAALGLLSMTAVATALMAVICSQIVAQRPASQGVISLHLGTGGELRLWNQPIRHQELPALLERAQLRSHGSSALVVRLIPEAQVPWGVVQSMLSRLQPHPPQTNWTLQLQLP